MQNEKCKVQNAKCWKHEAAASVTLHFAFCISHFSLPCNHKLGCLRRLNYELWHYDDVTDSFVSVGGLSAPSTAVSSRSRRNGL